MVLVPAAPSGSTTDGSGNTVVNRPVYRPSRHQSDQQQIEVETQLFQAEAVEEAEAAAMDHRAHPKLK